VYGRGVSSTCVKMQGKEADGEVERFAGDFVAMHK